jgi:hypothetical protein
MNFFNLAENRSDLNEMLYIIKYSLIHTLAAKHRLSLAKVIKRYGRNITVTLGDKKVSFDAPESLSAEYLDKRYVKTKRYPVFTRTLYFLIK